MKKMLLITIFALSFCQVNLVPAEARSGNVVTVKGNEFAVTFPHETKGRTSYAGNIESKIFETKNMESMPRLRAEFISGIDGREFSRNLKTTLQNLAYMAAVTAPEISIGNESLGSVGTYSGIKMVAGHPVRVYGKVFVGRHSVINLMIVEPLENSLSYESALFIDSVRKR